MNINLALFVPSLVSLAYTLRKENMLFTCPSATKNVLTTGPGGTTRCHCGLATVAGGTGRAEVAGTAKKKKLKIRIRPEVSPPECNCNGQIDALHSKHTKTPKKSSASMVT